MPKSKLLRETMERFNLFLRFDINADFDPDVAFTRSDAKTNSYTLINGTLISNELRDIVSDIRIVHQGDNLSDHCPVAVDINVKVSQSYFKKPVLPQCGNWKKLTDVKKTRFEEAMRTNLACRNEPFHSILHGDKCCFDDSHKIALEKYYCDIMMAVINAESILPKTNPNIERSFWDEELSELKARSVECNDHWKSVGCPKPKSEIRRKKNVPKKHITTF